MSGLRRIYALLYIDLARELPYGGPALTRKTNDVVSQIIQRVACQVGKTFYTEVANPVVRGLLNREKRTKERESLAAHPTLPLAGLTRNGGWRSCIIMWTPSRKAGEIPRVSTSSFNLSTGNEWAGAGRDEQTCIARSNSQARTGTGNFFFPFSADHDEQDY